jgi:hypothetical protein
LVTARFPECYFCKRFYFFFHLWPLICACLVAGTEFPL